MLISVIRPIPNACVAFIKAHEGCELTAYLDSAGIPTVGYGHTGPDVHLGLTITQATADDYLRQNLATAAQRLEAAVGEACIAELTANQYSAMISFVFNVGANPAWGIFTKLKAGQFDAIPAELMRFVNAGGRKLQGLVNRRAGEVKLWSTDEPGSVPDAPPSSVTRAVDTPPTAAVVKPLSRSKSFVNQCVQAGLAGGTLVAGTVQGAGKSINDAISPYVGQSAILQHLQGALVVALAASAALGVFLLWLKNQEAKSQ